MNNKCISTLSILCFTLLMSCQQESSVLENSKVEEAEETAQTQKRVPHNYGGYYCPDNLGGFPAVDIRNWESVPVVNGRMATREETQNGTSLKKDRITNRLWALR